MSDNNQITANRTQRVSFSQEECDLLNQGLKLQRKVQNKPNLTPNGYIKSMAVANAEIIIEEAEDAKE